jgi:multiple sugar transport system permease protein
MSNPSRASQAVLYALLALGAAITSFPFAWMVFTAFKSELEATAPVLTLLPRAWRWENFAATLAEAPFARYFFNTFVVALPVAGSVIATSLMAGYAFARFRFWGRGPLFAVFLATMMIPFEVTLIPNFIVITRLGWYDTYWALIVPWCASAFSIFLMRQAFLSLPTDFFDAATIDGCGHFRFLCAVGAPLVKPMAVTVGLFAFLGSYNSLIWPLVVTGSEEMRVVQNGLTVFAGAAGVRMSLLMCASTIVILPTVALYFAVQRSFIISSLGAGLKG